MDRRDLIIYSMIYLSLLSLKNKKLLVKSQQIFNMSCIFAIKQVQVFSSSNAKALQN